jgi:hypothetical protein
VIGTDIAWQGFIWYFGFSEATWSTANRLGIKTKELESFFSRHFSVRA